MSHAHISAPGTPQSPAASAGPVLSFKKRRNKPPALGAGSGESSSNVHSPDLSKASTPISAPGTPVSGSARKVSNRRKALQDFYKLSSAETAKATGEESTGLGIQTNGVKVSEKVEESEGDATQNPDLLLQKLSNEEAMQNFIKTASSREILRARNAAADKLNFHDSERKSIIYNNYSELIKLNHILSDVFADKGIKSEFSHEEDDTVVSNQSIDQYLSGLSTFLQTEAAVFNQDFASVVESVCSKMDGADSTSSVTGIPGE